MTSKEKKELKADLTLGYTTWMQQIYRKWSGRMDAAEIRIEVCKILTIHALTKIEEDWRRGPGRMKRILRSVEKMRGDAQGSDTVK